MLSTHHVHQLPHLSHRTSPHRRAPTLPALRFFGCSSLAEARAAAHRVLHAADRCPGCKSVIEQRVQRIGTTLFLDDDPRQLAQMFDAGCRDACTLRLLAACVLLYGRERTAAVA